MSYYYRENPKLSDKLRHKTGNDLLQKIKQQFDEDNNAFFEPRSARDNFERHAELPRVFITLILNYFFTLNKHKRICACSNTITFCSINSKKNQKHVLV